MTGIRCMMMAGEMVNGNKKGDNMNVITEFQKSPFRFGTHLDRLFSCDEAIVGVEVGVHQGIHAKKMLQSHCRLHLHGIDLWEKHVERDSDYLTSPGVMPAQFRDIEKAKEWHRIAEEAVAPFGGRCELHCMSSAEFASVTIDDSLDFVYIDADHSYDGCMRDLKLWQSKVMQGGIIAGHDYQYPPVKEAVDKFFIEHEVYHNSATMKEGLCWMVMV